MKYLIILLLGHSYFSGLSVETDRRTLQLSGLVADKYPIKMTLDIEKENVIGFYFYEKYKTKVLLSGELKGNQITLRESPGYESDFKVGFTGEIKNNTFFGVWADKINDKRLNFFTTVDKSETFKVSNQILNLEGSYENVLSSDKYMSSISLRNISGDIFNYKISNGTESGCIGYLNGLVVLKNLEQGVYNENLCEEIKFLVASNELTVNEKNCDFHGARCPFLRKIQKETVRAAADDCFVVGRLAA